MNSVLRLATVFAAGAAAMYYLDPQTGRRRRALVRDKSVSAGHEIKERARSKGRKALDQARGAAARTRAQSANEFVDDDVLRDRIRSKLGHLIDQSQSVDVDVTDGRVLLTGNLPNAAFDELVATVSAMPGVEHVETRPLTRPSPSDASVSQGARH